jgi:hypothetical protein
MDENRVARIAHYEGIFSSIMMVSVEPIGERKSALLRMWDGRICATLGNGSMNSQGNL